MPIHGYLSALGLAGVLALSSSPAVAHSTVSLDIHIGPGLRHHHGHVHYHGRRACSIRHHYYDAWPYYYVPPVVYEIYTPPPPVVFGDDCRWYRGRWHCY